MNWRGWKFWGQIGIPEEKWIRGCRCRSIQYQLINNYLWIFHRNVFAENKNEVTNCSLCEKLGLVFQNLIKLPAKLPAKFEDDLFISLYTTVRMVINKEGNDILVAIENLTNSIFYVKKKIINLTCLG